MMNKRTILGILLMLVSLLKLSTASATTQNKELILENDHVKLVFDGGQNYLFKSFNAGGVELLPKGGSATHPWQMIYRGSNGENPTLMPRWGYYMGGELIEEGDARKLVFKWDMELDGRGRRPVSMTIRLGKDSELPEWYINAELPQGWVITDLEFPRVALKRTDKTKAVLPIGYGAEYTVGATGKLQTRYPSVTGCMELVLMHNENGTVYFAATDKGGSGKEFVLESQGQSVVMIQKVVASYGWVNNGKFDLPWSTVLGFNKDNWQQTALKWYRPFTFETDWGKHTLKERQIADWIKNADMWLRPADVEPATMDAVRKALNYYGKGVGLHWYYWHKHRFDTCYPEYFPAQNGFKEMVKESHKMGAYVTPYINGRLWDPATESYKSQHGCEASCRKADGTLYTEVYGSKVLNTVTCPASDIWQNVLKTTNRRILSELKTDGVYMDQIGCAPSEPCYATNHNHAQGGGDWWPQAYRKVLTEMRHGFYKKNQAMTTEENAECYIDLFDMMLVVNSPHASYMRMVPLFPLIYADRCVYSGLTYIPWKLNDGSMNYLTMRSLLWGSQLGWVNPQLLMADNVKTEAAFLKQLTEFRRGQHDLFLGGRFLGEVIPEGDNEVVMIPNYQEIHVVMAALWESVNGEQVYIVVNMSNKDRVVKLPGGKVVSVKAWSAERVSK